MVFTVGSSVLVRSNESVGKGTIKSSLPRRPEDGPRTKRWIVVFADSVEREYTSQQLASTPEASTRKGGVPTKNPRTRKTQKNTSSQQQHPLSKEASALMQSFIKPRGSTKATAIKENLSSDSEAECEETQKKNEQPSQPNLCDDQYNSDSSIEQMPCSCPQSAGKGLTRGTHVKTKRVGWVGVIVKAVGRSQWKIQFDG